MLLFLVCYSSFRLFSPCLSGHSCEFCLTSASDSASGSPSSAHVSGLGDFFRLLAVERFKNNIHGVKVVVKYSRQLKRPMAFSGKATSSLLPAALFSFASFRALVFYCQILHLRTYMGCTFRATKLTLPSHRTSDIPRYGRIPPLVISNLPVLVVR